MEKVKERKISPKKEIKEIKLPDGNTTTVDKVREEFLDTIARAYQIPIEYFKECYDEQ